ncbi:hypothetical protein D910_06818 [Dendroctonus ponderosae]
MCPVQSHLQEQVHVAAASEVRVWKSAAVPVPSLRPTVPSEIQLEYPPERVFPAQFASPPVRCPNCGKDYKNKHSLYCHLRFDCGKPNNHGCTLCSYSTKRIHSLKRHMLLRHTQNGT